MTTATMDKTAKVVSHNQWLAARKQFLDKEKEFSRRRDELSRLRRELPWEKVEKEYVFEGANGTEKLGDMFDGRSQLLVYHFMFGPGWKEGCPSCSFLADAFDSFGIHLAQRDTAFVAVSRATLPEIEAFKKRMGWSFKWVSSFGSDFNHDYHVSFTPEELTKGPIYYNYTWRKTTVPELPGTSVFYQDKTGTVFHTYSCYERGLDMMNAAYHYLDLVPKGRDEVGLTYPQAWVRHHDNYDG